MKQIDLNKEAVRRIPTQVANEPVGGAATRNDLAERIRARFNGLGDLSGPDGLTLAPRHAMRTPPFVGNVVND